MALAVMAIAGAASAAPAYRWIAYMPGEAIQYGIADTDERALRIDCGARDGLSIAGPSAIDGAEGSRTNVGFGVRRQVRRHSGRLIGLGDGLNFTVDVNYDDPAVAALRAGFPVTVYHGDTAWKVPATNAERVLRPLIRACRSRQARTTPSPAAGGKGASVQPVQRSFLQREATVIVASRRIVPSRAASSGASRP
ncbi:hypothetical protein PQ455_00435 [Sphingomonas naphthae]|uniref:Uncharacterized protein n=1 Tax=Sphingomonas naphthae TaxID=1813468 RepID=A0ABY7TPF7_9SPHN|nr:hypothetical protein [Sphingomonas naphthae]WCT73734.1 hypothetical protein PQ455_00435 [Sphingomonas naphthae]